jgi:hypothetical protein
MLDRVASEDRLESARSTALAWKGWVRGVFRFMCAAALILAVEVFRRRTDRLLTLDRRTVGTILSFGSAGLLGFALLWRSRAGAALEVLESAAMLGFWTGFVALIP